MITVVNLNIARKNYIFFLLQIEAKGCRSIQVCTMSMLIDFEAKGKFTRYHCRKCYSVVFC